MRTITPCFFHMTETMVTPCYDSIMGLPHQVFLLAQLWPRIATLYIMPEFTPTQWMLDNHSQKGSADWEIFAECVREVMVKHGGFNKEERPIREKLAYEAFMNGEKETCELDGRVFTHSS